MIVHVLGVPMEEIAEKLAEDPGAGESGLSEDEVQILTMAIDESRVEAVQSGAAEGAGVRVISDGTTYFSHDSGIVTATHCSGLP